MSDINPFLEDDEVKFPCVSCGGSSVKTYIFEEDVSMEEFKEKSYVQEIDFGTYLRMNEIPENESVRVYKCGECEYHIGYLPKSGCRYIP